MDEPNRPHPGGPDGDPSDLQEHRMPGWVKGFIIVAGIAVAVLVVLALVLGGDHGPGRHGPGGGNARVEAPAGHTPPVDHG